MGMKFQNGSADKNTVTFTLLGDGTTDSASLQLTVDPFDLVSNNQPVAVSGPAQLSFGGGYYNVAYQLTGNPMLLNVVLTAVNSAPQFPPVGTMATAACRLIYAG